jgi:hypothetical protein
MAPESGPERMLWNGRQATYLAPVAEPCRYPRRKVAFKTGTKPALNSVSGLRARYPDLRVIKMALKYGNVLKTGTRKFHIQLLRDSSHYT